MATSIMGVICNLLHNYSITFWPPFAKKNAPADRGVFMFGCPMPFYGLDGPLSLLVSSITPQMIRPSTTAPIM